VPGVIRGCLRCSLRQDRLRLSWKVDECKPLRPGVLLLPVKLMKTRGPCALDNFLPLHKATVHHSASEASVKAGKAVTVVTYLHGTKAGAHTRSLLSST
jgi:hypothetical protein